MKVKCVRNGEYSLSTKESTYSRNEFQGEYDYDDGKTSSSQQRERERPRKKKKFISRTVKVKSANQQAVFIIHRFDV
jgi:hypothetical protein